ncbi:MAG: polysaccharide deacetylase family protein [Clostridia bacterium]|nr:polysaccharide deacetylase family protein [Clostridia bacterium]
MSTSSEFESRRRERRRRERLRKKRIRAAVILIALIGVIAILCVAVSTCKKRNEPSQPTDTVQTETTAAPEELAVPTVAPTSALTIPAASEKNNLMEIIDESGQEKRCYLTFDDGPTENITPQILDVLRRYNVKATFFEVGSLIKANPDVARRVYEEGHLIANHSNGHNYEKLYASTESFINEINECYEIIKSVTGEAEPFKLMRFPGGSYKSSADSYSPVKQECKTVLKENGFYYCDWNSLTGDAEGKKKNASELLAYLKQNLDTSESTVVLMHDAAAKQNTADALASVIEYLMSEGYTFHRLDEIDYTAGVTSTTGETASSVSSTGAPISSSTPSSSPSSTASTKPTSSPSATAGTSGTTAPTQRPTAVPANQNGPIIIN